MTLQDWMNRGQHSKHGRTATMTTPEPETQPEPRTDPRGTWSTAPDSEWLSEWAMIALSTGRVEMGYELARLARAALRCERHLAQHEAPTAPGPVAMTWERGHGTPVGEATSDELPPAPDATAVIAVGQAPAAPIVVPSGRCAVPLIGGRLCHGVAVWDGSAQRWVHMDPDIEQDHQASVPARNNAYDHGGGNGTV